MHGVAAFTECQFRELKGSIVRSKPFVGSPVLVVGARIASLE
jgi:hypothetical protein